MDLLQPYACVIEVLVSSNFLQDVHIGTLKSWQYSARPDIMAKKDKKDKKRSETEAALVSVEAEAVSAAGVGEPSADVGEVSMAVDGDSSTVTAAKKDKKKKEKKDKSSSSSSKKDKDGKKEKSKERKELEIPADALSPIAHPLAGRKLNKSTLKLVKRGACSSFGYLSYPLVPFVD